MDNTHIGITYMSIAYMGNIHMNSKSYGLGIDWVTIFLCKIWVWG